MKATSLLSVAALALVAACGSPDAETPEPAETVAPTEVEVPEVAEGYTTEVRRELLQAAADDADRPEAQKARDAFRNPVDTLLFFGVEPDDTVVEAWPGGGWYTQVLARYLASGGGKLFAAGFDPESENERVQASLAAFRERFVDNPDEFGEIEMSVLTSDRQELAPAGTADIVLTFRNVHNFEMGGWSEAAFAGFFEALKPGGVLGVVDHRLPEEADKAMEKSSGYVKVSTVRQLAEEAGFVFDGSSEVNANSNDDADHPFGVWTLPPRSRTTGQDGTSPEGFDAEEYKAIGESDRMTLRFKKPIEPAEALLE